MYVHINICPFKKKKFKKLTLYKYYVGDSIFGCPGVIRVMPYR